MFNGGGVGGEEETETVNAHAENISSTSEKRQLIDRKTTRFLTGKLRAFRQENYALSTGNCGLIDK